MQLESNFAIGVVKLHRFLYGVCSPMINKSGNPPTALSPQRAGLPLREIILLTNLK
ncbi:hypothetical protein [Nostoc sp. CCY0012]|uniref:hypothetical protein n=1 Tax=Nostoc sp. CCY0012 TaxID=1056123 RepID=UPI0039C666C7